MVPLVGIPATISSGLEPYHEVFVRESVFNYIRRYISGLLLSPNKTLQGIMGDQMTRHFSEETTLMNLGENTALHQPWKSIYIKL
ncbi:hypothetical protein [Acaryochloris sp. IP29b_bin.137]|uniref:hypothetical protein n=1 Tax=Acaryochloris sp. IP29b_bin.137 TaxID=2969217 RepID=UPI00260B1D62|nr:hypothetical protein [Acaryochloris sp. IP29b_bin.137]